MIPTFAEQSSAVVLHMFFTFVKAVLAALLLIAGVLVVGQSRVAPVSIHLLTSYAMEYAVHKFKPYRGYFPEPYLIEFENN